MKKLMGAHVQDHVLAASFSHILAEAQSQLCLSLKKKIPKVLPIAVGFCKIQIPGFFKIGEHFINLTSVNEVVIYVGIYQI